MVEEYLKKITVKIIANDNVSGAGVIIDNKHVLTCNHVVEYYSQVKIGFLDDYKVINASVIDRNEIKDYAILELKEEVSDDRIARLGTKYSDNDEFRSIGFALQNELEYINAPGKIVGKTETKDGIEVLQLNSKDISEGMSGAPVYNVNTRRIIGIISEHFKTNNFEYRDLSLAIPIDIIDNDNDIVKQNVERYKIDEKLRRFLEKQKEYFARESKIDHKRLKDYYVPNDLVKVKIDTWNKDEVDGEKWSIEEFLNGENRFIIIAADFGTGKTSYCYNIAYKLSEDYLNNAEGYIPILVELKNGFNNVYNNESLDSILNNNVIEFNKEDKILLIFDGLDEYNDTIGALEKIKNIKDSKKNIKNTKIILTTRLVKEYYDIFIRAEESVNPIGIQKYYVRIKPFNEEQVNEFFKKYLKIEKIEDKEAYEYFIDLGLSEEEVCKPLFAYMLARIYNLDAKILKIDKEKLKTRIEEEGARHRILKTIIYHNFTYSLLRGKHRELLDEHPTYEEWNKFYNKEKELLRVLAAISNIYDGEIKDVKNKLEIIDKKYDKALDIVITSYFRGNEETIRFIHKSFQEYFLAEYYYKMIYDNKTDMLNVGLPTKECIYFLHGIIDIVMNYNNVKDMLIEPEYIPEDIEKPEDIFKYIEKISDILNSVLRDNIMLHKQMLKDVNDSRKISIKDYSRLLAYKWIAASILSWLSRIDKNVKGNLIEIIRLSSNVMPYYLKNLSGADLSGADLSYAKLSGADLSGAELNGAELNEADLSKADLSGAHLSGADLSKADLSYAKLSGAKLSGARLYEAKLSGAELNEAELSRADLSGADLNEADLSGADLSGAELPYARLYEAKLNEADLSGARLNEAKLNGADLSGARLNGADLSGAKLYGADLSGARLLSAKLSSAKLSSAKLSSANLFRADLSYARLYGADLSYARLYGADLSGADLPGANLSGANLSGAKLYGAYLFRADLSEAKLYGADLSEAKLYGAKLYGAKLSGAKLSGAKLSGADITNVIFYLFSWEDKDIRNSNLANYLKEVYEELYGINIQEYKLTRNDKITLIKDNIKITIELKDNKAILTIDNNKLELDVIKEDEQTKIFIPIKVDRYTNTNGIILTDSDDKDIIKALSNLHPNLREIVLRDNPNYKEIWNEPIYSLMM